MAVAPFTVNEDPEQMMASGPASAMGVSLMVKVLLSAMGVLQGASGFTVRVSMAYPLARSPALGTYVGIIFPAFMRVPLPKATLHCRLA
ncbi:hypothetical protein DSECCO2_656800 [anaerobic digester metagenome]